MFGLGKPAQQWKHLGNEWVIQGNRIEDDEERALVEPLGKVVAQLVEAFAVSDHLEQVPRLPVEPELGLRCEPRVRPYAEVIHQIEHCLFRTERSPLAGRSRIPRFERPDGIGGADIEEIVDEVNSSLRVGRMALRLSTSSSSPAIPSFMATTTSVTASDFSEACTVEPIFRIIRSHRVRCGS